MNSRRRRISGALTMAGVLALAACSGGGDDAAAEPADQAAEEPAEEPAERPAMEPAEGVSGGADSFDDFEIGAIGRDVIVEMRVVVSTDDIARTVASIRASATALGGGVASADVDYGERDDIETDVPDGHAVLVVKVPPARADRLLAGLDDTATVESVSQTAQDVTEQLVDLEVRIANARQSVANVRGFMERAENLNDLVALEGELTRRQTDLERLEAQQRNLTDRVALSTITIEVIPASSASSADEPADDGIGDALRAGWDAFAAFVFVLGFVLAVLTPFLALAVVLAVLAWGVRRTIRSRTAVPSATVDEQRVTSRDDALAIHED